MPSLIGWAPDELVPARVLRGARSHFAQGWHDAYPPFHFYVLAAAYQPVLLANPGAIDIGSSAEGRQWRRGDPTGPNHKLFLVGRLISVAMSAGILLAINLAASDLFGPRVGPWAAATMALSMPFVYYAKLANVDVPATFWFSLALLCYVRALRLERRA